NKHNVVDQVADEHLALIARVMAAIKGQQLSTDDVQTSNMQFGENRVFKVNEWVRDGFYALSDMTVTVRDLSKYVPMWKALAKIADVSVVQIRFDNSKRSQYQDEARESALQAGKKKAAAMTATLGCSVGEILTIHEGDTERVNEQWYGQTFSSVDNAYVPR